MFSFFKRRSLLSSEDTYFQVETFKWLLTYFGGSDFVDGTVLVLPTKQYFPTEVESELEAVEATFEAVRKYCGLDNWPCKLEVQDEDIDPKVAPTIAVQNTPSNPLGTFSVTEAQEVIITYNPSLSADPQQMVATFAHELAHYLTATAAEPPPGGWENWEFATDIAATFLGFGVFMANNAFSFNQFTDVDAQGWQSRRNGYLSEAEHCFALALFLLLKKIPIEEATRHLKPNLAKMLKKANGEIGDSEILRELSEVEFKGGNN